MERCLSGVLSLGGAVSEPVSAIMSEVTSKPSQLIPVLPVTIFIPTENTCTVFSVFYSTHRTHIFIIIL